MTTRKDILTLKYMEFQKQLQLKQFDCSLFPSLEDVDLVDLLVLFNYIFNNSTPVRQSLEGLMKVNGIECSEEVKEVCLHFIHWFLDFQKNN